MAWRPPFFHFQSRILRCKYFIKKLNQREALLEAMPVALDFKLQRGKMILWTPAPGDVGVAFGKLPLLEKESFQPFRGRQRLAFTAPGRDSPAPSGAGMMKKLTSGTRQILWPQASISGPASTAPFRSHLQELKFRSRPMSSTSNPQGCLDGPPLPSHTS